MIGLFRYAFRLAPGVALASVLIAVVAAALGVAQPVLLGLTIGALPAAAAGEDVPGFLGRLFTLLAVIAVAQVIRTPHLPLADALGRRASATCCCD